VREHRRIELVHREWTQWKFDNPDGLAEQFVGWALLLPSDRRRRIVWYLTRRLSDPFLCRILGGTATFTIDDRRVRELPGVVRAQRFLQRFLGSDSSGIVTCNYDLLIEYALSSRYFNYGVRGEQLFGRGPHPFFPWQGRNPTLRGHLAVAKLHGSLSWDGERRYTDGRRGLSGEAQIVPPRPEKTSPPDLVATWQLARAILSGADRLVVFGFGFNPYDEAVLDLLTTTAQRTSQVLLIDVAPQAGTAAQIWPNADILVCDPPDRNSVRLKRWFNDAPSTLDRR
jgi:hypothetical protein